MSCKPLFNFSGVRFFKFSVVYELRITVFFKVI